MQAQYILMAVSVFLASFSTSAATEGLELEVRTTRACPEAVCVFGKPVSLQLVVSNGGSSPAGFLLQEHNGYGHRREIPSGLHGRLFKDGILQTRHDIAVVGPEDAEWFSSLVFASEYCIEDAEDVLDTSPEQVRTYRCEQPGDRVLLEPSESVARVIALDSLLRGAPGVDLPLQPGRYSIQLRLGTLVSKPFEFFVEATPEVAISTSTSE